MSVKPLIATLAFLAPITIGTSQSKGDPFHRFIPAIQVLDQKGKPIEGAFVLEIPKYGYRSASHTVGGGLRSVMTTTPTDLYITDGRLVAKKRIHSINEFSLEPLVVRLKKPGAIVEGRVVDENGQPLEGALVKCLRREGTSGSFWSEAKSDSNGKFGFGGLWDDFEYSFEIYAEGYGRIQGIASHRVREGRRTKIDTIALPIADSFIEGEVIDDWGRLVPDALVTLVAYPEKSAWTDARGRFRFEGLPKVPHMVQVQAGVAFGSQTIEGGKWKRIMLQKRPTR